MRIREDIVCVCIGGIIGVSLITHAHEPKQNEYIVQQNRCICLSASNHDSKMKHHT